MLPNLMSKKSAQLKLVSNDLKNQSSHPIQDYGGFIGLGNVIKKLTLEEVIDLDKQIITLTEIITPSKKVRSLSVQPFLNYSETLHDFHEEKEEEEEEEISLLNSISSVFDTVSNGLSDLITYLNNLEKELDKIKS